MLLSIIVPVYKTEPFLDACVKSIQAQTLQDWEMILVDDGSPDRCPEMCDQYAANDSRISVIHQKNGGLSKARNSGISVARGKYIAFVEVKTREDNPLVKASDAVDYNKRKRIIATSQFYLSKNPTELQPRFDVAEVYLNGYEVESFNYIKNAYGEE